MLSEKHRPQDFSQVIGQGKVIRLLQWYLDQPSDSGRAFLLTGPSGCGKTSLAMCVAEYWGVGEFDVHRIESAECDVQAVRRLASDMSYYGSGPSGRKVYVVDEIHTLSGKAADRLLSLLESLPKHVLIVATTTESNWGSDVLLSRWTRCDLGKPRATDVAVLLEQIAAAEGLPTPDTGWATKYCKAVGLNLRNLINQLPAHLLGSAVQAA